jgi:hypothetical protein
MAQALTVEAVDPQEERENLVRERGCGCQCVLFVNGMVGGRTIYKAGLEKLRDRPVMLFYSDFDNVEEDLQREPRWGCHAGRSVFCGGERGFEDQKVQWLLKALKEYEDEA